MFKSLSRIPYYISKLPEKLKLIRQCVRSPYFRWVGPGHFYSPFPDMAEVARRAAKIYPPPPRELAGINLRGPAQAALLEEFKPYYSSLHFDRSYNPASRYHRKNGAFPFQDAFMLHAMIRHFKPRRLIEAGCGYSTCVILDTCEALRLETQLTFIEPYPEFLLQRIRTDDRQRFELMEQIIQDVDVDRFASLQPNDILFIDTSHVSKVGSDVNHIFFEILPRIKPGVLVHFHDVWYPFEYPHDWLHRGMFWTEAYLLRAFLMENPNWEIMLFNGYLSAFQKDRLERDFPLCLEEPGPSIWLRRVG